MTCARCSSEKMKLTKNCSVSEAPGVGTKVEVFEAETNQSARAIWMPIR